MRIAVVHSFYRSDQVSGENVVVERQLEMLERAGHQVLLVAKHTDEETRAPFYGIRSAARVATGFGSSPEQVIRDFDADIVHVHNLFPNFGTAWMRSSPAPVVASLHNFRALCANGLFLRDGRECFLCPVSGSQAGVRHRCYRNSALATLPLAVSTRGHGRHSHVLQQSQRLVIPSERMARTYRNFVAEPTAEKIEVIPNGLPDAPGDRLDLAPLSRTGDWCFVGRLSAEKGLDKLLNEWPQDEGLLIVGDGPLRTRLELLAGPRVRFLGHLTNGEVIEVLRKSEGLVFSSLCTEGQPSVLIEALMCGTPILARRGSSGADIAESVDRTWVFSDALSLRATMNRIRAEGIVARQDARRAYLGGYTEQIWLKRLENTYRAAITES